MDPETLPGSLTDADLDQALGAVENPPADTQIAPAPDPVTGQPAPEDPVNTMRAELDTLKKAHENLQGLYGRQANELGSLRRRFAQPEPEAPKKPTNEEFLENPSEATEKLLAAKEAEQRIQAVRAQNELAQIHDVVANAIPTFVNDFPTVIQMLVDEDKVDPSQLTQFQQNPYQLGPAALYHMTKRAQARNELVKTRAEVERLKGELEQARKAPGKIADKINNGLRSSSAPTSLPPTKTNPALIPTNSADMARLTDEELERAIKLADEQGA